MGKGISTIGTKLLAGSTSSNLAQLCKIKSYPDLGSAPNNLETTDLEDDSQTFCEGVKATDQMEFTANYTAAGYAAVKAQEGQDLYYQLEMGESGADGKFQWQGRHSVYVNSGDVDSVREMTIVVTPSTSIEPVGVTGWTGA